MHKNYDKNKNLIKKIQLNWINTSTYTLILQLYNHIIHFSKFFPHNPILMYYEGYQILDNSLLLCQFNI